MSTQASKNPATSPQDMERVREILFGGVIRDYDARFATQQRDLERLQRALEKTNEQLAAQDSAQNKKLQEARQDFQTAIDDLRAETRSALDRLSAEKVDREQLGNLLIEMGNQIKGTGILSSMLDGLLQTDE
ncbi:MAG: hypothetical protein DWI57_10435 [Chloroflexi bacterium]|nr:MAG: hypothetical protein DWI57_10435 [Chloroflexota bacterium]